MNKIAISVGHYPDEDTREIEYPNNVEVAQLLHNQLALEGYYVEVFEGTLPEKVSRINQYEPGIAVECHFNRMSWPHDEKLCGSGYEVCTWTGSVYGKMLGSRILEGFEEKLPWGRRGKYGLWERKDLYFLKHTRMPAVILEPLFLDNLNEAAFLKMKRGHQFIAEAAFIGITKYFKDRL